MTRSSFLALLVTIVAGPAWASDAPAPSKRALVAARVAMRSVPTDAVVLQRIDKLIGTMSLELAHERARTVIAAGGRQMRFPDGGEAKVLERTSSTAAEARIDIHEPEPRDGSFAYRFHAFRYAVDGRGRPAATATPVHEFSFADVGGARLEIGPGWRRISLFGNTPHFPGGVRYEFERHGDGAPRLVSAMSYVRSPRIHVDLDASGAMVRQEDDRGNETHKTSEPTWLLPGVVDRVLPR